MVNYSVELISRRKHVGDCNVVYFNSCPDY